MKKFTRLLICLILCVFGVSLFGCKDNRTPDEKAFTYPASSAQTSGNGGLAVKKGNYIYFVNGFKSATSSERNANNTLGGIMLAKLDNHGELVVNDNGELKDDYFIHMSGSLAGFEATDLAVFGNYLYFTSVCQEDDAETDEWANTLVDFNRIKLDKSSDVERIYQSKSSNTTVKFKYYENNGEVALLVFEADEKELIKVNASGDSTTVATGVLSVNFADNYNEVFCVCETGDNAIPYKSYRVNAVNGSKQEFMGHSSSTTVEFVENGFAYVLENDVLTRYNAETAGQGAVALSGYSTYTTVKVVKNSTDIVAVSSEDGGMIVETIRNGVPAVYSLDTEATEFNIIGFANGSVVYRDNNSNIKTLNYAVSNSSPVVVATVADMNTTYFDIDGSFLYFYKKVGSNEYLHRLVIDNGAASEEFVGVYLDADQPEADDDAE